MSKRIEGYLRALDKDELPKYHDYQDVYKGKLSIPAYEKKWGRYNGAQPRRKHVQ